MISDCPPGHASEVSKERFLEENDFSCSWPLSRQVRTTVSTARYHETACMAFSLLPFALVGRRIFPTTVDLCRPLSTFPSSLLSSSARWSATNGMLTRSGALAACCRYRSSFGAQLAQLLAAGMAAHHPAPGTRHPCSSRDSRSSVGRLRIVLPKITSQKLASYF